MGNRTSFLLGHKATIKLVDADGKLRLLPVTAEPITAAELMLDNPGFAVSCLNDLMKSGRISAICADEVLRGGKTYLLVPLGKVNAKMTEPMMTALGRTLSMGEKKKSSPNRLSGLFGRFGGGFSKVSRVSPVDTEATAAVEAEGEPGGGAKVDLLSVLKGNGCLGCGVGRSTSSGRWCPVLDPIIEE